MRLAALDGRVAARAVQGVRMRLVALDRYAAALAEQGARMSETARNRTYGYVGDRPNEAFA